MKTCEINLSDVYRYLGYKGKPDDETIKQVAELSKKLGEIAEYKGVYQIFPIEIKDNVLVSGTTMEMGGENIKTLLGESDRCVLMAVTIGQGVDRWIRELQVRDMSQAVIVDACASSLVEEYCNALEAELKDSLPEGEFLTDRFSPGYGDLPLDVQPFFCKVLNTSKKMGLTLSQTNIMSPKKSITAVLGISDKQQPMRIKGCGYCQLRGNCEYRKGGKTCGSSSV